MTVYIVNALIEDQELIKGYAGKMLYCGNDQNVAQGIYESSQKDAQYKKVDLIEYVVD